MSIHISKLPHDVITHIAEFLEDKDAMAASQVCKSWHKAFWSRCCRVLQMEDVYCLRIGFHLELIKALRRQGISCFNLPVLDIGKRMGSASCIDFLTDKDVTSPLMRFKDKFERLGFAIRMQRNSNETSIQENHPFVFAIFQRCSGVDLWVPGGSGARQAEIIINQIHDPDHEGEPLNRCSTCPISIHDERGIPWTAALLSQTAPGLRIHGKIEQLPLCCPSIRPPIPHVDPLSLIERIQNVFRDQPVLGLGCISLGALLAFHTSLLIEERLVASSGEWSDPRTVETFQAVVMVALPLIASTLAYLFMTNQMERTLR